METYALVHQSLGCFDLSSWWLHIHKSSDKGYANGDGTISIHMLTLDVPAASYVYLTIAAHQKVIANVDPTKRFHMERLNGLHAVYANILGEIELRFMRK